MKVYYVANFYMPFGKAYGIQLAKMCEAFIEAGMDLTLILPRRGSCTPLQEFYGLRTPIPALWLPALDLKRYQRAGYALMAFSFSVSYVLFLWWRYVCGERYMVYTIDADRYSSSLLALVPAPLFSEMHGSKPATLAQKLLFSRLKGVMAINRLIAEDLRTRFPHSQTQYAVEPNGVDLAQFAPGSSAEARAALGLPPGKMVLYAGRFFDWKGLEIIPEAASHTPEIRWQLVGGTKEEFAALVNTPLPANMHFAGVRPHAEMPLWASAADALLVLGTKRDEQSYRWTSPMKLFEYLVSGRPIVASSTPAIQEVVSDREVFLYEPDDAKDLAEKIEDALGGGREKIEAARTLGMRHSWEGRARRIMHFMGLS